MSILNMMSINVFLSLFVMVYNVPIHVPEALPTPCPERDVKNNARYEVLELIERVLQDAVELKNMTGKWISRFKHDMDALPPYEDFPSIVRSSNCSICQIHECFSNDCESLETLIRYMNSHLSIEYSDKVGELTVEIENLRERMKCDRVNVVFGGIIQFKGKDYRISKDIVNLFQTLMDKYYDMDF